MTAVLGALASVALAALVALSAYSGTQVVAAAVALVVLAVALGWGGLFDLPGPVGSAVAVAGAGWAAVATALAVQHRTRPLAAFAAVLALGVLVAFARELVRRAPRDRLVESLTGTLAGEVVTVLGAAWLLVPLTAWGTAGVLVAAAAVAAARLAMSLPWPASIGAWVGLATGTAAAAATAFFAVPGRAGPGALVGVAVAAVAVGLDRLLTTLVSGRGTAALVASSAAPVAAAGVVAYAVTRLLAL